ncbi:MAG: nuclear transport factor 2 family protein [Cyclobacteriaceae bacterium]|nr:nuclear transport factor 2 family protein [Cyclobacteriaceae bacterium]
MNQSLVFKSFIVVAILLGAKSCTCPSSEKEEKEFLKTLQIHLDAVSNKEYNTLEKTLSPSGKMELILPQSKITYTSKEFLDMHKEWFQDTTWTFETKILNSKVDGNLGIATVEILYKEPDRNGKPYFNRMAVGYVLEKEDGKWYVIKDQACSLEKSTD